MKGVPLSTMAAVANGQRVGSSVMCVLRQRLSEAQRALTQPSRTAMRERCGWDCYNVLVGWLCGNLLIGNGSAGIRGRG